MIYILLLQTLLHSPSLSLEDDPPSLSILLQNGDDENYLLHVLNYHRGCGDGARIPEVLGILPGPVTLASGWRIIPTQRPPALTVPGLLVLVNRGDLELDDVWIAFIDRCLQEGTMVWIVGETIPEALTTLPLAPGERIDLVAAARFPSALEALLPSEPDALEDETAAVPARDPDP